ncbi:MAG TPA: hypothetical protein VHM48_12920 [Candidatus Limnocylindrales bacterium]|nr:hypothetical protein [Candidatus Limnocylindrales bacterium]
MTRRRSRLAAAALAAMVLGAGLVGSATAGHSDLNAVRAATARFHSLAAAGKGGFGQPPAPAPLHECISSLDGTGAMGFHYINGSRLDKVLDPTLPEVLVYAPDADGKLHLAALEYVIFQADWYADHAAGTMPTLLGQDMMPNNGARFQIPPFFALHVWLFQDNPSGMFAPFNPDVSCGSASAAVRGSGSTAAAAVATADVARTWACEVPARSA